MSSAFTKEDDAGAMPDIGERPVSQHRNLVTPGGLAAIEAEVARLRQELGAAETAGDREAIALASEPEPGSEVVRFGMTVTLEGEDGAKKIWRIVGEDEADAAHGSISHVSPMAQALFGKGVGDVVTVGGREWEVVEVG